MTENTQPNPDLEPTPEAPAAPAGELPTYEAPAAPAPTYEAPAAPAPTYEAPAAPAQWPAEGYPPPPAYPSAEAYPAAYPPPAYAAAAPSQPVRTSSNAVVALILAVVSWAVCPIIPAIVSLVFASNAAKEIDASGGRIQGQGLVTASRVVSWVNIGLWSAVIVVGAFFLVLAVVAGGLNDSNGF